MSIIIESDHKYFSLLPNMIDEILIDPYEMRLYMKYKRIAGDGGICFMSNEKLAKSCGMSEGKLISVKKSLAKPRKELGGKSLICIKKRFKEKGDKDTDEVTIIDLWEENIIFFKKKSKGTSPHEVGVLHLVNQGTSPGEDKEEPSEEEPSEEEPPPYHPQESKIIKKGKEDWWGCHFKKITTRELFDNAWNEYEKSPIGSVKDIRKWLTAVISRISSETGEEEAREERIYRRKKEAETFDNFGTLNTICAAPCYVEFICGVKTFAVEYDIPDQEWFNRTKNAFERFRGKI